MTDPEWDAVPMAASDPDERVLALHEALDRLAAEDPAKAALVEMRYFGGLTIEEAAQVQGISAPTAKRRWAYARAWLFKELQDREPGRQHPRG